MYSYIKNIGMCIYIYIYIYIHVYRERERERERYRSSAYMAARLRREGPGLLRHGPSGIGGGALPV